MGNDSECNPPMEEEGNSTALPETNQDQHDADQCGASKQPGMSSTVPGFHAGTEASGFGASSCSYEKFEYHQFEYRIACGDRPLPMSTDCRQGLSYIPSNGPAGPRWIAPNAEQDIDADGLISCQLSTDYSVDLMSTLSVTEGPISLTSSVTSTASSCYTPRRQRILGQSSTEATSKSRKLHSGDGNTGMRGKDRMRYVSAGSATGVGSVFQKIDKNVAEVAYSELSSQVYRSDRELVGFGCNSIAEVSRHNCLQHSDDSNQIYHKAAELPLVISENEEVQLLYERAIAAEYENKQLRNRIEALELECNLLRSSSNITGKEILGVLSHIEDGNDCSKSIFALKCSNDLRFSRSPYAQQSSANFGDDFALQPRDLFDPFHPLCYDSFKDGEHLPLGTADENGGSGSATRMGDQLAPAFSRAGFARMSRGISRDSRSEERCFPGMANPSHVHARSAASFATLQLRQADLGAQHYEHGSSESLLSVIGPKEQFFLSPNALEASLYNVRGDSAFHSDGPDARPDLGPREAVDRAGQQGRWHEGRAEGGGPRALGGGPLDAQGTADPPLFMVV